MKIYTRTGDSGDTSLFGGARVPKDHPRILAYGTIDETNAVLGMARAVLGAGADTSTGASGDTSSRTLDKMLDRIQRDLFVVGADLATPAGSKPSVPRISAARVEQIEQDIDRLEADLSPLRTFILPGGCPAAAALHSARTTCRRAEREVVAAMRHDASIDPQVEVYVNRLSDFLFVAARWANHTAGIADTPWTP